jgi:hypothetical protein
METVLLGAVSAFQISGHVWLSNPDHSEHSSVIRAGFHQASNIHNAFLVLKRIYGTEQFPENYSTTLNSVVFVGTILGMLTFGANEQHSLGVRYSDREPRLDLG